MGLEVEIEGSLFTDFVELVDVAAEQLSYGAACREGGGHPVERCRPGLRLPAAGPCRAHGVAQVGYKGGGNPGFGAAAAVLDTGAAVAVCVGF